MENFFCLVILSKLVLADPKPLALMTVDNKLKEEMQEKKSQDAMLFNQFETSGELPKMPTPPEKDPWISVRRRKLPVIKMADFRFERLG